jgi:phosphoribosylformylglycinamidine synthase PurS subunit
VTRLARVIVTPKPVVNDPQGLTVKQGLRQLGFDEVADVRVGKYLEVRLSAETSEEAHRRVKDMCVKLLANHVIEDYRFEVESAPSPKSGEEAKDRG